MGVGERTRFYQIRPRRIPPEFCTDELLEGCSILAALLLYRLISQADDQGRLPGHPRSVRASTFAMRSSVSESKVEAALTELTRAGFIFRYDVGGRRYIQISRWFDLQGKWGQRRTYPSRYPAPPGWTQDWVTAGVEDELRAPSAQDDRDVPPPSPSSLPSSSSSTGSLPNPSDAIQRGGSPTRIDELLDLAKHVRLPEEDALAVGAAIASPGPSRERT